MKLICLIKTFLMAARLKTWRVDAHSYLEGEFYQESGKWWTPMVCRICQHQETFEAIY